MTPEIVPSTRLPFEPTVHGIVEPAALRVTRRREPRPAVRTRGRPPDQARVSLAGEEAGMVFHVDLLGPERGGAFRALRLDALARHPCAFAAAHDEELTQSAADVAERLAEQAVFGAFVDDNLVGVAGFATPSLAKKAHKGLLWGVYVGAGARGQGVGKALVRRVIDHARGRVIQLHAAVAADNPVARGLYRDLGFRTYGLEPRALRVGDRYFDQELMVLMLDETA
jgi:ribosomal protein S18 acetylase RimI-like enzyme